MSAANRIPLPARQPQGASGLLQPPLSAVAQIGLVSQTQSVSQQSRGTAAPLQRSAPAAAPDADLDDDQKKVRCITDLESSGRHTTCTCCTQIRDALDHIRAAADWKQDWTLAGRTFWMATTSSSQGLPAQVRCAVDHDGNDGI